MFGALLLDFYAVFTKPGVALRSGFFGPAERALRDAGANVEYIPADFRRFVTIAEQFAPRVMTTAAAPPDDHGLMSLSLHAGATVGELHRAAADPDRLVIVEVNDQLPRTLGHPAAVPARTARRRGRRDRARRTAPPYVLADDPPDDVDRAIAAFARRLRRRRLHVADRDRGRAVVDRRGARRRDPAATTACTRRCSRPGSCACTSRAR